MVKAQTISIDYIPHEYQAKIHNCDARFRVADCGRRFGKTKLGVQEVFWFLGKPKAKIWWVAPYWDIALIAWRMFLDEIPAALIKHIDRVRHCITMINDACLWFKSADDPGSLVGEGLDFVVIDEAAKVKELAWTESIRPMLGDVDKIGKALFIGTPKGLNWFYQVYLLGKIEGNEWMSFSYPSWLKPRELWKIDDKGKTDWEKAKEELPERIFRQEYGAEFLDDLGTIFRHVKDCISGELEEPREGESYVAGVDFGKQNSFTVICVLDSEGHLCAFERFKEVNWNLTVDRVVSVAKKYMADMLVDSTGVGDPLLDFIASQYDLAEGYKIKRDKVKLIDNLAIHIEKGARKVRGEQNIEGGVSYPEVEVLIDELKVFGVETKNVGRPKYSAPKGFYDDCVIALALAIWKLYEAIRLSHAFIDW